MRPVTQSTLTLVLTGALAGVGVSAPAKENPKAAGKDAPATQPAGGSFDMLQVGRVEFLPPDGWIEAEKSRKPNTAAFVSKDHMGMIAIQSLPPDAGVGNAAVSAILRQLADQKKKAKQEIILAPQVEKDAKYDLKVHEKYRSPGEKTADAYYLYRKVGGTLVLTTVKSLLDGDPGAKIIQAGESVAQSARVAAKSAGGK